MGLFSWIVKKVKGVKQENAPKIGDWFIADDDALHLVESQEFFAWYSGDDSRLLAMYKQDMMDGFLQNILYTENKRNMFWASSAIEHGFKRVHSGIPRFLIDTLNSNIDFPTILADGKRKKEVEKTIYESDLEQLVQNTITPFTAVGGTCALKPKINKDVSDYARVKAYKEGDFELVMSDDEVVGVVFDDFMCYKDCDYMLSEIRYVDRSGDRPKSVIDYKLFKLEGGRKSSISALNKLKCKYEEVPLSTIPNLESRCPKLEFDGVNEPLATIVKFVDDPDRPGYGRSFMAGKIGVFDDLDQAVSQQSQAIKVSTPIEYFNTDFLSKDENGNPIRPSVYNRQYIDINGRLNGDGDMTKAIEVTQPEIRISEYKSAIEGLERLAVSGWMSPATIGLESSATSNADASREREKVTRRTVDICRERLKKAIKRIVRQMMILQDLTDGKEIEPIDDVIVRFPPFSGPSFESRANVLTPMYTNKAMSPDMFVKMLYKGELSAQEESIEIERLKKLGNPIPLAKKDGEQRTDRERAVGNYRDGMSYDSRPTPPQNAENATKA